MMPKAIHYCKEELATVRGYLDGRTKPRNFPDKLMAEKIVKEQPHLTPFICFSKDENELFGKISSDKRAKRFSDLMFFPVLESSLETGMERILLNFFTARTRGWAAQLAAEGNVFMIKPVRSPDEPRVARFAGENKIGPAQYPTLGNFITEEFMAGGMFNRISRNLGVESARRAGEQVGSMLGTLHNGRVLFNAIILADDSGGSRLIMRETGARMMDFGVSIDLSAFPAITDEQLARYMMTLPVIGEMMRSGRIRGAELEKKILALRERFAGADVKDILSRDLDFVGEGIYFSRIANLEARHALYKGFEQAYEKATGEIV